MDKVLARHAPQKVALFLDNCRVHHSKIVQQQLKERGVACIFNIAYSPQLNPIEYVWACTKNNFKRQKLAALIQFGFISYTDMASCALRDVPADIIRRICEAVVQKRILID